MESRAREGGDKTSFKELRDALNKMALNPEYQELSDEELEEAWKFAKLVVDRLQHMKEKRKKA